MRPPVSNPPPRAESHCTRGAPAPVYDPPGRTGGRDVTQLTHLLSLAELTPEQVIARVFLDIAIVVAVARVFGALFRKIHQPAVVGEIFGGIMLGPSFLGLFNEDLPGKLFPAQVVPFLAVVANLGLILFMFIVGLEVDIGLIRGKGRLAAVTSITSVILPFTLGMLAASALHGEY